MTTLTAPRFLPLLAILLSTTLTPTLAYAEIAQRSASALLEEIIISARKYEERAQDAPLSVSAFNSNQIDAMKVRDLSSLSVGIPNVALDDVGTIKGTANFSIRGLGINSSIPSIDPTVGVFVDGVYLGINNGVIFDTFDIDSIEVLRGPQGTLFGRNVTGGAILINSKKPGDIFESSIKAAVDGGGKGGYNTYLMGTLGGPISDSFSAKITAYYNDDEGWFENLATGNNFGAIEQKMIRPSILWRPTDTLELYMKYEFAQTDGDGPASQSHTNGSGISGTPVNYDRNSHDFSVDDGGYLETETNLFSAQLDWDIGKNGTITNIFGYRDYEQDSLTDIDAQPLSLFHVPVNLQAEQISNELRYNGLFIDDRLNLTTGLYYFENEILYHERRNLLGALTPDGSPALTQDGGGDYKVKTMAIFLAGDYDLTNQWTLTTGIRYTKERKEAQIASLIANVNSPCNVVEGTCAYDFVDDKTWKNWSPKLGLIYSINDDSRIYGHWTRGYRSGGYNLRNTSGDVVNNGPGPFNEEGVNNYEIGYKSEFSRGRLNTAIFYNEISDMQREVNLSDPVSGVVQIIKNTADVEILGIEVDATFIATDNFLILSSVGWLDPEYTEVFFDLNGDGVVDDADKALDLPRAANWTYSLSFVWDVELGAWGYMTARGSYAYRDDSVYTDNNLGILQKQKIIDAGLDFYSNDERWVFSLYGKNLANEVKHGGDTQLPADLAGFPLGGTFSPLAKGRHYGAEITINF